MHKKITEKGAFTLVEILVVLTIFGFVMAGVLPFFISNLKSQFIGEQKLLINGDIRKVTNQMVENAREANSFTLYQAFADQKRWDGANETRDQNGNGVVDKDDRLADTSSGDFMVLVFYTDPYKDPKLFNGLSDDATVYLNANVNRLVGYWVAPNRKHSGENAVYTFDTDRYKAPGDVEWTTSWGVKFPITLADAVTIESLLPPATAAYAQANEFPILLNNVSGLSNGYTFVNYRNKSIITRAKILHGNLAKRVTNTYNFTITPRG